MNLDGINWIIVGGESGMQARPMKEDWALNVKQQAETMNIPFSLSNGELGGQME